VLSVFIGADERIVTIEDTAELQLRQEHVAKMECRPPNLEGEGSIKERQLVINSLRMRPSPRDDGCAGQFQYLAGFDPPADCLRD
jgi:Flp pilus assembly CpaF family ATPase